MSNVPGPLSPRACTRLGAYAATSVWLLSCGASAPPPPPAPLAIAAPAAPPPAPPPDLSPVEEPANIVGLVRVKALDAVLSKFSKWTGIPGLTSKGLLRQFTELGKDADVVATGAAVDAVVALDPAQTAMDAEPLWAVSIGVTSLDDAVRAAQAGGGAMTLLRPGVYRFTPATKKRHHHHGNSDIACALAVAIGDAPARVVCSDNDHNVDALLPYMTRTLPNQDLGPAEAHAEIRVAGLVQHYGAGITRGVRMGAALAPSGLKLDQPVFDGAVNEASGALAEEVILFLGDLERLTMDLRLGDEALEAETAATFRDHRSWIASTATDFAGHTGPAPSAFWKLPSEANSAGFSGAADPKRFVEIRRVLAALLDGWLAHEGLASADRAALVDLLSPKYASGGAMVYAGVPEGPKPAKAGALEPTAAEKLAGTLGSRMWCIDAASGATDGAMTWVKAFVRAAGRPKVQDLLRHELAEGGIGWKTSVKAEPTPRGLPAGSFAAVATLTPESAPSKGGKTEARTKASPIAVHVVAMPEPGQTWMAVGIDPATLLRRLLALHAALQPGAPDAGTLATKPGLEALRQGKYSSGGYATLSSYLDAAGPLAALAGALAGLTPTQLPHQGQTPILVTSSVTMDAAPRWTGTLRIPKDVFDDALAAFTASALGAHP